jgi:hypothetical protein
MLPLGFSEEVLPGARLWWAHLFASPTEQVIAEGRLVFAALSIVSVEINLELLAAPTGPEAFNALLVYAAFAIALVLVRISRFQRGPVGYAVHALDIAIQLVLTALTEAHASPVLAFFTFFVLLASSCSATTRRPVLLPAPETRQRLAQEVTHSCQWIW